MKQARKIIGLFVELFNLFGIAPYQWCCVKLGFGALRASIVLLYLVACGADDTKFSGAQNAVPAEENAEVREEPEDDSMDAIPKEQSSDAEIAEKNTPVLFENENVIENVAKLVEVTQSQQVDDDLNYTPVDIIFAVDTSGSMNQEKKMLEDLMGKFINDLSGTPFPLNFQVFMLGNQFNFPMEVENDPRFEIVPQRVGSFDGLQRAAELLNGFYPTNLTLRDNAYKELIIISDDNARGVTAENFISFLPSREITVHGLVGFNKGLDANQTWCNIARVGEDYEKLAQATNGILHNLCDADWQPLFERLIDRMIRRLINDEYKLKYLPANPENILVRMRGQRSPLPFSYKSETNSIVFDQGVFPIPGEKIEIKYAIWEVPEEFQSADE